MANDKFEIVQLRYDSKKNERKKKIKLTFQRIKF